MLLYDQVSSAHLSIYEPDGLRTKDIIYIHIIYIYIY